MLYAEMGPSPFTARLWQIQTRAMRTASTKWEYTFEIECMLSSQYLFGLFILAANVREYLNDVVGP